MNKITQLYPRVFQEFEGTLFKNNTATGGSKPLRKNYSSGYARYWGQHEPQYQVNAIKAYLRHGQFAWPGGYQLAFVCEDGAYLCFQCVEDNWTEILDSLYSSIHDGWTVIGIDILDHADTPIELNCENCHKTLKEADECGL